jgi:hypothetical protein
LLSEDEKDHVFKMNMDVAPDGYNQFCGSDMFIPDPGSYNKTKRGEKNFSITFFVATNIIKLKIILFFNR